MNKSSASPVRRESPSHQGSDGDGAVEMPSAVNNGNSDRESRSVAGRRLRNAIILANAVAWLAIAALVKWFFF